MRLSALEQCLEKLFESALCPDDEREAYKQLAAKVGMLRLEPNQKKLEFRHKHALPIRAAVGKRCMKVKRPAMYLADCYYKAAELSGVLNGVSELHYPERRDRIAQEAMLAFTSYYEIMPDDERAALDNLWVGRTCGVKLHSATDTDTRYSGVKKQRFKSFFENWRKRKSYYSRVPVILDMTMRLRPHSQLEKSSVQLKACYRQLAVNSRTKRL